MTSPAEPIRCDKQNCYRIRVSGRLSDRWAVWFDGMDIQVAEADDRLAETTLTGPVTDQAALMGALQKLNSLGLDLLEVKLVNQS